MKGITFGNCVNANDSNFNTVEKTGCSATHKLSESEMQRHQHNTVNANASGYIYDWTTSALQASGTVGYSGNVKTRFSGSGSAHNNLQPYITCYMLKRTS